MPGRGSLRGSLILACMLGLLACEPESGPVQAHPAAVLPEACHSILSWAEKPDAPTMALLRSLKAKGVDRIGIPEIFFEGPGVLAVYTDPDAGWSSPLAFVDLPGQGEPDLDRLRAGMAKDFVLETQGRRLWMLPKQLAGFPESSAPRLGRQGWFVGSLQGLPAVRAGEPDPALARGLELHLDLSRLLDIARSQATKEDRSALDLMVGIESFLSLGMRVLPDARGGQGKIDLYFRLARSPVGIAAALDVDSPGHLLEKLIPELPEDAGYLLMNFRVATLTDALKAKVFSEDGTGIVGVAKNLSRSLSFLLRGDLPRAFGNQWAIVDPEGKLGHGADFAASGAYLLSTLDYSKKLGDTMLALAKAGSLLGKKVDWEKIGDGLLFETKLFGLDLILVLGKQFGAISTQASKSVLLDLLAREKSGSGSALPFPKGLPAIPENAVLRGRGHWSLDFLKAFLPAESGSQDAIRGFLEGLIAEGRRFSFQSLRVEHGLLLQGRW